MKVEPSVETYQVAYFKARIKAILVAPLKSFERFFSHFELPCRSVFTIQTAYAVQHSNAFDGYHKLLRGQVQIVILSYRRWLVARRRR